MKKHHEQHRIEKVVWLRAAVLGANFHGEHRELTGIYMRRGLDFQLAQQVAGSAWRLE